MHRHALDIVFHVTKSFYKKVVNMVHTITNVQIVPVKPQNGLVAFASFVYADAFYVASVGIYTRPSGGFRLTYPTRKSASA